MVPALAGALALAGVAADAVTFVSRVGRSRHGRTRQEKGCGGGGDSSTRLRSNFHDIPPKDVGNDFKMRIKPRRRPGSRTQVNLRFSENDRRPASCNPLDLQQLIAHPELTTDVR